MYLMGEEALVSCDVAWPTASSCPGPLPSPPDGCPCSHPPLQSILREAARAIFLKDCESDRVTETLLGLQASLLRPVVSLMAEASPSSPFTCSSLTGLLGLLLECCLTSGPLHVLLPPGKIFLPVGAQLCPIPSRAHRQEWCPLRATEQRGLPPSLHAGACRPPPIPHSFCPWLYHTQEGRVHCRHPQVHRVGWALQRHMGRRKRKPLFRSLLYRLHTEQSPEGQALHEEQGLSDRVTSTPSLHWSASRVTHTRHGSILQRP